MLEIKGLYKAFHPGTINETKVIQNLSLTIHEGDFITVIGGNGAGKSTFLNLLCGSILPDAGNIYLDGKDISQLPEHKRASFFGRVFQDPMLGTAGNMGIDENLSMAARKGKRRGLAWGISSKERESYEKLLKGLDLGLETRMTTKVRLLSGGQRQALTLLMATLVRPRLLLLDEHTAALDPKTQEKIMKMTDSIIQSQGLSSLMITHNMKDALAYGNRLIMLNKGRIVLDVKGDEKKRLKVSDLLELFKEKEGEEIVSDALLLG